MTPSLISPSGSVLLHRASCSTSAADNPEARVVRVQLRAPREPLPDSGPRVWTPGDGLEHTLVPG